METFFMMRTKCNNLVKVLIPSHEPLRVGLLLSLMLLLLLFQPQTAKIAGV